ncbi:hypothetical protein Tco_0659981 [Tanacetum coccineum]
MRDSASHSYEFDLESSKGCGVYGVLVIWVEWMKKAVGIQLRAASPSTHHLSDIPSPPLLLSSTTHRDDLLEGDMPLRKIARFTIPTGRFEVGESSFVAAARQAGHTLSHRVDYGFVDTMDTSIHASESRAMTAIGDVNDRVTDLATNQRQDTQELYVRCEDAQNDRALLRAQAHSKSKSQAMEAQIRALLRDVDVLQRTAATTTPMTDAQIKALISQGVVDALAEHKANRSRNGDDSHDSGSDGRRRMPVAHECTYTDFLKCQLLNFKGTEGVVALT